MNKTVMVHIRMQTSTIERIDRIAEQRGESRSTVIRGAVHAYLDGVSPGVVRKIKGGKE